MQLLHDRYNPDLSLWP